MKLNCKPGDLAIVVRVFYSVNSWMLGRIVHCSHVENNQGLIGWRLESPIIAPSSSKFDYEWVADRCLRPISNDPGADETLSWCDVPSEVMA